MTLNTDNSEDEFSTGNQPGNSVVISVNPNSGSADRTALIRDLQLRLQEAGYEVDVLTNVGQVVKRARQLYDAKNLRVVVAAGGDGTASLLANQLPVGVPLTILPLGTENLLARHLGLSTNVTQFVSLIRNGQYQQMDAGRANGKLFLVMASCGFDAEVVEKLHQNRKGHISYWSWFRPIISSLRRYRYPELQISIDTPANETTSSQSAPLTLKASARWLFVFNAPRYAMNLPLLPEADPHDGALDMCSFRYGGVFRGIVYLVAVVLKKHRQWCKTEFGKFRKMTIRSNSRVPFQLDGDPGGELPVTIEVLPEYLTLLVPAETDEDQVNKTP